jgi:hypothetical protein
MPKHSFLKPLITFFLIIVSFPFLSSQTFAQGVIKSDNFEIQLPNLNSGAGIPSSTNYKTKSTIGQTAPGLFSSTGYRVKSGFQYVGSIIPFSFSISKLAIAFGSLTPQTPATDSHTLTVSAGGAGGYQVLASENYPMTIVSGSTTIPDTLCDTTCSETTAAVWTSTSKYGFGFNMTGNDIPTDFTNSTYFRQFANRAGAETPKAVMSSVYVGRTRIATVTYKVNIAGTQAAGNYQNIVTYTAVPSF